MPDDHSELVPPLPIPNRTVKRLRADDSAETSVKVGYRQALTPKNPQAINLGVFAFVCLQAKLASVPVVSLIDSLHQNQPACRVVRLLLCVPC